MENNEQNLKEIADAYIASGERLLLCDKHVEWSKFVEDDVQWQKASLVEEVLGVLQAPSAEDAIKIYHSLGEKENDGTGGWAAKRLLRLYVRKFCPEKAAILDKVHADMWDRLEKASHMGAIRFAKQTEINEILAMYKQREEWLRQKKIPMWVDYTERHTDDLIRAVKEERYYVYEQEGKIVAGLAISNNDSNWFGDDAQKGKVFLKHFVSVQKNAGKDLLEYIFELHECYYSDKFINLDCQHNIEILKRYYKKLGFREVGEIDAAYHNGAKACLMSKTLGKTDTKELN